jgi:hypothetical protein
MGVWARWFGRGPSRSYTLHVIDPVEGYSRDVAAAGDADVVAATSRADAEGNIYLARAYRAGGCAIRAVSREEFFHLKMQHDYLVSRSRSVGRPAGGDIGS